MNFKTILTVIIFLFLKFQVSAQIVPVGLIAYYQFTGNTYDATSNHYDLINNDAIYYISDRFGRAGHAGYFDGIAYAYRTPFNLTDSISISFWTKTNVFTQNALLVGNGNSGLDGIGITMVAYIPFNTAGDNLTLYMGGIGYMQTPYAITDTDWKFIAFTYKNGTYEYYVNDTLLSTGDSLQYTPSTNFIVGATWNSTSLSYKNYFQGAIDDIRVYDKVLSAIEVDSLYHETAAEDSAAGVAKLSNEINFEIYPNPAKTLLHVQSNQNLLKGNKVVIKNLFGVEVYSSSNIIGNKDINLQGFVPGVYSLSVYDDSNTLIETKKLIIDN